MPDQEQMETMQERMEQLEKEAEQQGEEETPVPQLVTVAQMMAAILPRRAGDILFFLSGGQETGIHVDRIIFIYSAPVEDGPSPAVIRYDMEHDGKRTTELVTTHTIEQLRGALQK